MAEIIYILNESNELGIPGDVEVFQSEEDLLRSVEPIDVENEEYFVLGSTGARYELKVVEEKIVLQPSSDQFSYREEVANLLITLILSYSHKGPNFSVPQSWLESAPIDELLAKEREFSAKLRNEVKIATLIRNWWKRYVG